MRVDSKGAPVSEGTYGFYNGNCSARVERTYINPLEDDASAQKILANGGYIIDIGSKKFACLPAGFTATNDGEHVFAADGTKVEPGDQIELSSKLSSLKDCKTLTVKSIYPIATLKGNTCLSLEEKKGSAPDGHYAITWGNVKSVIKKADKTLNKKEFRYLPGHTDKGNLNRYDYIRFVTDEGNEAYGVINSMEANRDYIGSVWLSKYKGKDTSITEPYFFKRENVKEIWSFKEGPWPTSVGFLRKGDHFKGVLNNEWAILELESVRFNPTLLNKGYIFCGKQIEKSDGALKTWTDWSYPYVKEIIPKGYTIEDLQVGDRITFRMDDDETIAIGVVTSTESSNKPWDGSADIEPIEYEGETIKGRYLFYASRVISVERNGVDVIETVVNNEGTGVDMAQTQTGKSATELKLNTLDKAAKSKQAGKVDVVNQGTQIILPETGPASTTKGAITELQRRLEQEEMDVNVMEIIDGFPLDAAVAFIRSLESIFGWVNAMPTPGFFGSQPPTMIGVKIDAEGNTIQVPWGQIQIPGVTGKLATGIQVKDGNPVFCIQGTIKQKDKKVVAQIAKFTKDFLRENSIYKGKAIRVTFPSEGEAWSPLDHQPDFINTAEVKPEELIFSEDVQKQIRVNIWTPIVNNAAVRAARVPLKRGVLLFGRYGVGKTLLATVTARLAVQQNITFIDLAESKQLPAAIRFARTLGGMVVIFAEDIDLCNQDRSDGFNEILNTVDGLTSKTDEVLIVYTTNHIEKISKAMLRQGRIDKVIEVKEPNAEAACRLVRLYARHMLSPTEDISTVGEAIASEKMIPAAIREIVEQSKLAAIARGDTSRITGEDLMVTVEGTRAHNELLKEPVIDDRSEFEKLGDAMGTRIGQHVKDVLAPSFFVTNVNTDEEGSEVETQIATEVTERVQKETSRRRKTA